MTLDAALRSAGYGTGLVCPWRDREALLPALRKRCMWRLAAWLELYLQDPSTWKGMAPDDPERDGEP